MTEPPRRKRFQIHLSTAIVMMFVAGALIWANVHGVVTRTVPLTNSPPGQQWWIYKSFGWPLSTITDAKFLAYTDSSTIEPDGASAKVIPDQSQFGLAALFANSLIALAFVFAAWFICEHLLRRRAARKDA